MAEMTLEVEKVDTYPDDDRGRVAIGKKYAEEDVEVAVIGVVEGDGR